MSSNNRKGIHALLLDYDYPLERLVGKDWPADGMVCIESIDINTDILK